MAKEEFKISTSQAVKSLNNIEDSIKDIGQAAGLSQKQIELMTKQVKKEAQEIEKESNKVKKGFGGIESLTGKLGKAMSGAFAVTAVVAFGNELLNLEKQYRGLMATVSKFSKENGAQLKSTTAQIKALSKTYGQNTNDIIIATNNLAKQQSISFAQSLDLVTKGLRQNADAYSSSQFIENLKEYPGQLKRLGATAKDTISILTVNTEEGFFSDKFIDSLKEAGLSLTEFTDTQRKALEPLGKAWSVELKRDIDNGSLTILQALEKITDRAKEMGLTTSEQATILADVFKGAGEDAEGMERIINALNKALQFNLDELDQYEQATKDLEESTKFLEDEMVQFFSIFEGAGENFTILGNLVGGYLVQKFNDFADSVKHVWALISTTGSLVSNFFSEDYDLGQLGEKFNEELTKKQDDIYNQRFKKIREQEEKLAEREAELARKRAIRAQDAYNKALKEELDKTEALINQEVENFSKIVDEAELAKDALDKINKSRADDLEKELARMFEAEEDYFNKRDKRSEETLDKQKKAQEELKDAQERELDSMIGAFSVIGSLIDEEAARWLEFGKTAIDTIKTIVAAKEAEKAASDANTQAHAGEAVAKAGSLPFPGNLIAIATTVATLASAFGAVKGIFGFNKGVDSVPGIDQNRDVVPALLTPGERVVTRKDNRAGKGYYSLLDSNKITHDELSQIAMSYHNRKIGLDQSGLEEALSKQPKHITKFDKNGFDSYIVTRSSKANIINKFTK